jgi:hypothetical protein
LAVTVFCEKELVLQLFAKQQHTTLSKNVKVFRAKCKDFSALYAAVLAADIAPGVKPYFIAEKLALKQPYHLI